MSKFIKFKKLDPKATIPSYAHDGDIGLDVTAVSVEYDEKNDVFIYGTGLACETEGHMGVLGMMRSGVFRRGAYLTNAVGLIDSDQYRGEIKYIYRNVTPVRQEIKECLDYWWDLKSWWWRLIHSKKRFYEVGTRILMDDVLMFAPFDVGEKIGQLVPLTFDKVEIWEFNELSETERGEDGFGSTDNVPTNPVVVDSTDSSDSSNIS